MDGSPGPSSSCLGLGDGGGSMTECDGDLGLTIDSGNALTTSVDEVSIVMCTVSVVGFRGA
jgi:hypothetical protein